MIKCYTFRSIAVPCFFPHDWLIEFKPMCIFDTTGIFTGKKCMYTMYLCVQF